jgi:DHA1 family inner membrane transport protein
MAVFTVGNLATALAPAFGVMLAGRVVASFAHGAFFGIGSIVAAELVAPERRAAAIAAMFSGLTVANVVGAPLGTLVGQQLGWRVTFALVAALGVVGLAGVARFVPELPRPAGTRLRREWAALRNAQVLLAMAMTVLGFGGVFAAITYVAPVMTRVAGYPAAAVTGLLVLFGLGMVAGNLVGGRLADRALMPVLVVTLGALAVVLAVFTVTAHQRVAAAVTLALIGALGFATVPPLQKRVLDQAAGAPTLASALNIGAFNLGNALAAWLGGLVISAGYGWTAPSWVGAALATAALAAAATSTVLERRGKGSTPAVSSPELVSSASPRR